MDSLEARIAARPGPKVTKEEIEAKIFFVEYVRIGKTVTICAITMANGHVAIGKSACVDPRNFDEKIGRELAYKDAFGQLWALEGYLLADRLQYINKAE